MQELEPDEGGPRGNEMNREEFVRNYVKELNLFETGVWDGGIILIKSLIGSIYDQQQMIEYLDSRIIDLERIVYAS